MYRNHNYLSNLGQSRAIFRFVLQTGRGAFYHFRKETGPVPFSMHGSSCPTAMDGGSVGVAGAFTCLTGDPPLIQTLVFGDREAIRHAGNVVGYNARLACLISVVGGRTACELGRHLFQISHVKVE